MSVPHSEQASPLLVKDGYFSAKGRKTSPNPDESSTSFFFTHFVQRGGLSLNCGGSCVVCEL